MTTGGSGGCCTDGGGDSGGDCVVGLRDGGGSGYREGGRGTISLILELYRIGIVDMGGTDSGGDGSSGGDGL